MQKYGRLILVSLLVVSCSLNNKNSKSSKVQNVEHLMEEYIKILIKDSKHHKQIGSKLTETEIQEVQQKIGLALPYSYKLFLKHFGNGAYWLYSASIDDIKQYSFLNKYHKDLGKTIELVGEKEIEVDSLLCLMTEDSNGGAWVWLTSENTKSGEWPLAYYSLSDRRLHYKVENFTEWIRLLTKCKSEVIRELDKNNELNLG